MNIPSITNNAPLAGTSSRPVAADATHADLRQTRAAQVSDAAPVQTQQAVKQTNASESTSKEQLEDAVKAMNDFLKQFNNSLQFNIDDDTGKTVVKVVDSTTNEVIKQFPSEEMLAIAKAIDKMKGLLVQQKA